MIEIKIKERYKLRQTYLNVVLQFVPHNLHFVTHNKKYVIALGSKQKKNYKFVIKRNILDRENFLIASTDFL